MPRSSGACTCSTTCARKLEHLRRNTVSRKSKQFVVFERGSPNAFITPLLCSACQHSTAPVRSHPHAKPISRTHIETCGGSPDDFRTKYGLLLDSKINIHILFLLPSSNNAAVSPGVLTYSPPNWIRYMPSGGPQMSCCWDAISP